MSSKEYFRQRYQEKRKEILARQRERWPIVHRHRKAHPPANKKIHSRNWRLTHKAENEAHMALNYAVRSGKIIKPDKCSLCGKEAKIQAHHHNGYDKDHWLDVIWFCQPCHALIHRHRRNGLQFMLD